MGMSQYKKHMQSFIDDMPAEELQMVLEKLYGVQIRQQILESIYGPDLQNKLIQAYRQRLGSNINSFPPVSLNGYNSIKSNAFHPILSSSFVAHPNYNNHQLFLQKPGPYFYPQQIDPFRQNW